MGDAIRSLGVWAVFVFAALDSVGLPASGDAAVVLGAATLDEPLAVIVLLGFAGAVVGDHVVYWVGRLAGRVVVPRLVGAERQRRVEAALDRHAAVTLVGGRLVTAIRSEVASLAGAVRLPYARFVVWNAVGCLVWAMLAALAGRLLGQVVDVEPLLDTAERWSALVGAAVVVAVATVVAWRACGHVGTRNVIRHRTDDRRAAGSDALAEIDHAGEGGSMHIHGHAPRPGDVIEVESQAVGSPGRSGEILEVLGDPREPHFRVRWEDGHESIYYPSNDARVRVGPEQ